MNKIDYADNLKQLLAASSSQIRERVFFAFDRKTKDFEYDQDIIPVLGTPEDFILTFINADKASKKSYLSINIGITVVAVIIVLFSLISFIASVVFIAKAAGNSSQTGALGASVIFLMSSIILLVTAGWIIAKNIKHYQIYRKSKDGK